MNRNQAIEAATNLRKGMTVASYIPASKDESGNEVPAWWKHETHKSISLAKKHMRALGRGVALVGREGLPD